MFSIFNKTKQEIPYNYKYTAQNTIRYKRIYEDGVMEIEKGIYSKSINFVDINYQIANAQDQQTIFEKYCSFLNSFDTNVDVQITINNKNINEKGFEDDVLLAYKNDSKNNYRDEYNNILKKQIEKGRNNIVKEKYMTLTIRANNYKEAKSIFNRVEGEVEQNLKLIGSSIKKQDGKDRLQILSDFFNDKHEARLNPLAVIKRRGLKSKDAIAPSHFFFKKDYFEMDNKYARALYLKDLPSTLADTYISELTNINANLLLSINIKTVETENAFKLVQRQLAGMNTNKLEAQKKAIQGGYSPDLISYDLQSTIKDAEELLNDLKSKNQKMFLVSMTITHTADSLEALNDDTDTLYSISNKYLCKLSILHYMQEEGLTTTIPIGNNKLHTSRTLTTESTAIFVPFTSQELFEKNGIYYGINAVSKNLICFDRTKLLNASGWIIGVPGSGKSFSAKEEIINVALATNDDILILDPQGEYSPLVRAFGGEVIEINATTQNHINALDMNKNYTDEGDPIQKKSEYFLSLVECLIGSNLTAKEKSIIDRTLRLTYNEYVKTFNKNQTPTLKDFLETLQKEQTPEADKLATELELYIDGSLNLFAHKTNIDLNSRIISFDTKDLGRQLKSVGMLVVLDLIWNRITENAKKKRKTWIYIDEIYLLFNNEYSTNFLFELYKKVRKFGGIPTGITQNIEDLLCNDQARRMLSNSEFIMMLNQAPTDRKEIAKLLNISSTQLSYVTNTKAGSGLLIAGGGIIPFENDFPKDTELYKLITTKPDEV
jgi:type IV secretory pathway VirB4 component